MADETITTYTPAQDQSLRQCKHTVSLKRYWDEDWQAVEELFVVGEVEWLVAPSMSRASLAWRYGERLRRTATIWANVEPYHASELIGQYVRIEFDGTDVKDEADADNYIPPTFYGKVMSVNDRWAGDHANVDGDAIARGDQVFSCLGMEAILDQTAITSSFVITKDADGNTTYKEVNRCIPFNRVNGNSIDARMTIEGNKDPGLVSGYASAFSGTLSGSESEDAEFDPPEKWTLGSVLEYLFEFHAPRNLDGDKIVRFEIRRNNVFSELNLAEVQLDRYEGLTLFQILNHLIDRRRGLGWFISPKTQGDELTFEIVLFSYVNEDLELPIGGKLSANDRLIELDLSGDRLAHVQQLTDGTVAYDQIIARGDRRGAVFNLGGESFGDDDDVRAPLVADYDESTAEGSMLDDYIYGASRLAGFDALPELEQHAVTDRYRRQNKFLRLGSWFSIDPTWNGKGMGDQPAVCPKLDPDGEATDDPTDMWLPGIRLRRNLPLLSDIDYSGAKIHDEEIADQVAEIYKDAVPEYLPTMVFVRCPFFDENEDDVEHWVPGVVMGARAGWAGDWNFSVRVGVNESKPGVVVTVNGGQGRTLRGFFLGRNQQAANADDEIGLSYGRDVDDLLIVAYAQFDEYAEVRLPLDDDVEDAVGGRPDTVRKKVVYLPDCHLDWVPKGTVVGYSTEPTDADGTLKYKPKITTVGAFVRDDRERLETAAKLAQKFYCRNRQSVSIKWQRFRQIVERGWFVERITQEARTREDVSEFFDLDVNTPVTAVRYDPAAGTMSIDTGYGELDVAAISKVV